MNNKTIASIVILIIVIIAGAVIISNIRSKDHKDKDNKTPVAIDGPNNSTIDNSTTNNTNTQSNKEDKVEIKDVTIGTGDAAKNGDKLSVEYTGKLTDGTVFDSTDKRNNQPFSFTLGAGQVIEGWDQGMVGMQVGGTRELTIPPSLGYGTQGQGSIPPNSTLIFTVKLDAIN